MSNKWEVYFVEYGLDAEEWDSVVEVCDTEAEAEAACAKWMAWNRNEYYMVREAF